MNDIIIHHSFSGPFSGLRAPSIPGRRLRSLSSQISFYPYPTWFSLDSRPHFFPANFFLLDIVGCLWHFFVVRSQHPVKESCTTRRFSSLCKAVNSLDRWRIKVTAGQGSKSRRNCHTQWPQSRFNLWFNKTDDPRISPCETTRNNSGHRLQLTR